MLKMFELQSPCYRQPTMNTKLVTAIVLLLFAILAISITVLVFTVQLVNSGTGIDETNLDTIVVNTVTGEVRGKKAHTLFERKPYYSFKGIPYAKPPLGDLRFKAPQPAERWNNVRDAFDYGNICPQYQVGDEDCLFVNVHTPAEFNLNSKWPVLVVIHGGAYFFGSGGDMGPDFLLNAANLVIVTINYRLGPLGFLSLGTPEYSGNMGLKDQLLAIKWANENVHNFGGDKNKITVYGLSAGSTSTHLHVLSPASNGLFQRAIMASGAALNPFAYTHHDRVPALLQYAENNGITIEGPTDLLDYLKAMDARLLVNIVLPAVGEPSYIGRAWSPVIEAEDAVDPFMTKSPAEIFESNFQSDIDTMFGVASMEGYAQIDTLFRNPALLVPLNEIFRVPLPLAHFNQMVPYSTEEYRLMSETIRNHYFDTRSIDETTLYEYARVYSDTTFNFGINQAAQLHGSTSSGKTFFYRFSVDGRLNGMKLPTLAYQQSLPGATHADDLYYVFGTSGENGNAFYNTVEVDSMERRVISEMSKIYANFIVYGNPTPGASPVYFEPVRNNVLNFMDITNDGLARGTDPFAEAVSFWETLFAEHNLVLPNSGRASIV